MDFIKYKKAKQMTTIVQISRVKKWKHATVSILNYIFVFFKKEDLQIN